MKKVKRNVKQARQHWICELAKLGLRPPWEVVDRGENYTAGCEASFIKKYDNAWLLNSTAGEEGTRVGHPYHIYIMRDPRNGMPVKYVGYTGRENPEDRIKEHIAEALASAHLVENDNKSDTATLRNYLEIYGPLLWCAITDGWVMPGTRFSLTEDGLRGMSKTRNKKEQLPCGVWWNTDVSAPRLIGIPEGINKVLDAYWPGWRNARKVWDVRPSSAARKSARFSAHVDDVRAPDVRLRCSEAARAARLQKQ